MSYQIDPVHSQIQFTARHLMVTNVRGQFDKFSGTVEFDENNPAVTKVDIQIDAASVNTKNTDRDNDLRSANFLDVANHPYVTFKSKRVELLDKTHARLVGDLTIHGVTKEVALDVEYAGTSKSPWNTITAGFTAQTSISRKEWGLTYNAVLETGGVVVGDEIKITIDLELAKQAAAAAGATA